ncbi:9909_t:CDS:1 [Acaulospora morrowiae]|uniref:9909_t:CDS:1 n=1 Tax=Acaulospora morrowiae TaxID=94023 RepID=A0A9N8WBQ6_9GLOM|nr:9909_t:CDS:1 [Acaulospora morrowiae]
MLRGNCLINDLKILINNRLYSDLEIKCKDGIILYGNRAVLAARSEVFNKMLFSRTSEISDKQISFQKIESAAMKIILEYLYTGSILDGSLSIDNAFETFNAADFFQLKNLQDIISNFYKQACKGDGQEMKEDKSPELLSKAIQVMSSSDDNGIIDFLVKSVAKIPLDTIGFDRLSLQALRCLLSNTNDNEKVFVTSEYSVLRFTILLSAKNVSQAAFSALKIRLPLWNKINDGFNFKNNDTSGLTDICTCTANNMAPLIEFIDLRRIEGKILIDIIEPLNLIPHEKLIAAYRYYTYDKDPMSAFRGKPFIKEDIKWDRNNCGPSLFISPDGYTASCSGKYPTPNYLKTNYGNHVRTNSLMINGIHELHVKIKNINFVRIGVCGKVNQSGFGHRPGFCFANNQPGFAFANDQPDFGFANNQPGFGLGNNQSDLRNFSFWWVFLNGATLFSGSDHTVPAKPVSLMKSLQRGVDELVLRLNMDNKECICIFNGREISTGWINLPPELYFFASLDPSGTITIMNN